MRKVLAALLLLIPVWIGIPQARAQEADTASSPWERIWSSQNCRSPRQHLFMAGGFILTFLDDSSEILRLDPDQSDNVIRIRGIKQPYDLKLIDDTLYKRIVPLFVPINQPDDYNPFTAEKDYLLPYRDCGDSFKSLPAFDEAGLALFKKLGEIDETCGTATISENAACQTTIFSYFDRDMNSTLDISELNRAYRLITYIGASTGCQLALYFPANTKEEGSAVAAKVMALADKDQNQGITLEELSTAWEKLQEDTGFKKFENVARNTSYILPFIPPGEAIEGCSCQLEVAAQPLPTVSNK